MERIKKYPELLPSRTIVEMLLSHEAYRVKTPQEATHFSSVKADGEEFNVYVKKKEL